jgi:hypothetical protein
MKMMQAHANHTASTSISSNDLKEMPTTTNNNNNNKLPFPSEEDSTPRCHAQPKKNEKEIHPFFPPRSLLVATATQAAG